MTMPSPSRTTFAVLAALSVALASAAHAAQTCETLTKLDLPATSITLAESPIPGTTPAARTLPGRSITPKRSPTSVIAPSTKLR